jgi:AraC-like DNA-binding protein
MMRNTGIGMSNTDHESSLETERERAFPFMLLGAELVRCQGRPEEDISRNQWPYCTVELILEGEGVLLSNGLSCKPRKGDVYILHRHSRHRYYPDPQKPWTKLFFCVTGRLVDQLWTAYGLASIHHIPGVDLSPLFWRMEQLYRSGVRDMHRQAALLFHEIVGNLHFSLGEVLFKCPPEILQVKSYLDEHLEEKVALADLCRLVLMSEAHIIRSFKKALGQTPYEYLLGRRLERAQYLLSNTFLTVKEIAARLQFADPFYFSNFFKRRTGLSPTAFRGTL